MGTRQYRTLIKVWKGELERELRRKVTWREIAAGSGVAYSTLLKHAAADFDRPDFATAQRLADWFNGQSQSRRKWTPLDYFVEVDEEGNVVGMLTVSA